MPIKYCKVTTDAIAVSPQLKSGLEEYQRNLQVTRPDMPDSRLYDPTSLTIGAKHLAPPRLLEEALDSEGLVVVPHGPLHLIPWAGMVFNGKRLFEYCPVGVLPNLSCVIYLDAQFHEKPKAALLGAPNYGRAVQCRK